MQSAGASKPCTWLDRKVQPVAEDNKTEKATEHRRRKAREEGQVARSRELGANAAMLAGILVLVAQGPNDLLRWRQFFHLVLDHAVRDEISIATPLFPWAAQLVFQWSWKPLAAAWGVATLVSLSQGGIVFAPKLLAPDINKINPVKKLGQIFSVTTLVQVFKALIPSIAIIYIAVGIFQREWPSLGLGLWASPRQISFHLFKIVFEVFWKSSFVLLAWAVVDYIAMRQKFEGDLRMSKEEIREEMKQNDGNPQTKGRIRRLQRQARRKRMLQATKSATVVVTNPTHFAVALEYRDDMAAPTVVAKGQNLFAQQIKEIARWDGIPIVENPPLAQSLYRTVEVGQAIPEKLYAAVAEILAYVFRINAQRMARGNS
jgi:flagellar biosynthetic protein FlhB